ncbi:MAG: NAD-binding protein [Gemmatimonadetes bacterium]|nr:NAD-binding protein [Gemmatimonadota bacterium]
MVEFSPIGSGRGGRFRWRPFVWRGLAFALVVGAGLAGLRLGVGVTERNVFGVGLAAQVYYVLGLFVLGGLDIGTPVGGPRLGRMLLWGAYFVAPIITASAVIDALLRLVRPLARRLRTLNGHVVVGGAGQLSSVYARKLRERSPQRTLVVVEQDPNHPSLTEFRDGYRAVVLVGDITEDAVLRRLRLDRAHRVLFLTGDDFANLDAAAKVLALAPRLAGQIVVHVSNLGFMRETAGSRVARDCEVFNGHEFAATKLVHDHLLTRFVETVELDLVVLAGFGRFGQTVLKQLQEYADGRFSHVVIVDERASAHARDFAEHPGFSGDYGRTVIDGDVLDPDVWDRIQAVVEPEGRAPVVVLGTGVDSTNVQVALRVRKHHPDSYVVARSFRPSPFSAEIVQEAGAHPLHLAGLIGQGMPERWF